MFKSRNALPVVACAGLVIVTSSVFGSPTGSNYQLFPAVRVEVSEGEYHLALGAGPAFHVVQGAIEAPAVIDIKGSPARVVLWSETPAGAAARAMYAISLDGQTIKTVQPVEGVIKLRFAEFDPLLGGAPVAADLADDGSGQIHIVQFHTQPLEEYRTAIRGLGGDVLKYLAHQCQIVRMGPMTRAQVAALPFVRWVGPYHPAYRAEEFLIENRWHAEAEFPLLKYNIQVFEAGLGQKQAVAAKTRALGGIVEREDAGKYLLEATLTPTQLWEVLRWDEVMFVDRWSPYEEDMAIAREIGGANYIESLEGYDGTGVRGTVLDTGFNTSHSDFASRPLILQTAVSNATHGASTSGIIFGDGTGDATARGLLPAGQGIVADADVVGLNNALPRYTYEGQLIQSPYFSVIHSSSVGSTQVTAYTTISTDTDAFLFDFQVLHCQSQSNTGNQTSRPQAWAKNMVSVGGIKHKNTLDKSDDCWNCSVTTTPPSQCSSSSSSRASIGPAADGRVKPDLCHFYENIRTTTGTTTSTYTNCFGGTSGATPITAGHFGLFFQMWADGVFGNTVDPSDTVFENRCKMMTAKAMMINTASQYPFTGTTHDLTRTHQGWGMADLKNMYDLRTKMLIIDESQTLANLDTATYQVFVAAGEPALRVTMCYLDPEGTTSSTLHRINDLSLRVTSPTNVVYWGNNGLLAGVWSTSGGSANTIDTVENVFVQTPEAGTWTIEVIASAVNQDSHTETPEVDADFALVASYITNNTVVLGDMNCDGVLDPLDVSPFALALVDPVEYAVQFPSCQISRGDMNSDSLVDGLDMTGFVDALLP